MTAISYPFNPFQELAACHLIETIAVTKDKAEYVPRVAPFFGRKLIVKVQGNSTPLTLGRDYVFAHPFDEFTEEYKRGVYGSIVLLVPLDATLEVELDTVGGPFVLDDVAYAEYVANILNSPRYASWSDLNPDSVPETFPVPPHNHPAEQTYDYLEMTTYLRSLVLSLVGNTGGLDLNTQFANHVGEDITKAHAVDKAKLDLDRIPNYGIATETEINQLSNTALATVNTVARLLKKINSGEISI